MQIPIIEGIYANTLGEFVASHPVNLEPSFIQSGISNGFLRSAPGVRQIGTGPGPDRGSINWNGICYRVMGSSLISVTASGTVTNLGNVGDNGVPVSFDYSFDRLAIASNRGLFYYTPSEGVTQVTDPDLGLVLDVLFIDGRFMTTDGTSLVITELNDPYSVDPLKYGSSEASPDPIVCLISAYNEAYALNRFTIENFGNRGKPGFPFERNAGAMIPKGCVGTHAKTPYLNTFAFVGGGWNEKLGVYIANSGDTKKLSTRAIDDELAALSEEEASRIELECRTERDEERLYVHLPTKTLVFSTKATAANGGVPVWHILVGGTGLDQPYAIRHYTLAYDEWICGDDQGRIGVVDPKLSTLFGELVAWRFDTVLLYDESRRGIIHDVELVGLPGQAPLGDNPMMFFSSTQDGRTWSQERAISLGMIGQRQKRMVWRPNRMFAHWMGFRFRAANEGIATFARLEARIERLGS